MLSSLILSQRHEKAMDIFQILSSGGILAQFSLYVHKEAQARFISFISDLVTEDGLEIALGPRHVEKGWFCGVKQI